MSFVAISKLSFPAELAEKLIAVGHEMIPLAKKQKGFISIAFHHSEQENQTAMVWEWESEADHLACMQSSDWSAIMEKHGTLFQSQGVEFSLETYQRLA